MKKWMSFIIFVLCFTVYTPAEAKVTWDGTEIVKGQTGKIGFTKDVKVYKKNGDGTFTSLVVKKGEFYRVYGYTYSTVGKVYKMSGGYLGQVSELLIYKEVPLSIQQQASGVKFTVDTNIFASSASGVSIKQQPNGQANTLKRAPYGSVFKVLELAGDYVRVEYYYDTEPESRNYVQGYVPEDFVSNLPKGTVQYINQIVELTSPRLWWYSVPLKPGISVNVHFTTTDGRAYVSTGNIYGYVPLNALSKTPYVEKVLSSLDSPNSILFDRSKNIWMVEENYYKYVNVLYGEFKPINHNSWKATITISDPEGNGEDEVFDRTLCYAISQNKLTYTSEDLLITMQFPVKLNDTIYVNGQPQRITKMYEQYPIRIRGNYTMFENVIIAGDVTIAKGLIYWHEKHYWLQRN